MYILPEDTFKDKEESGEANIFLAAARLLSPPPNLKQLYDKSNITRGSPSPMQWVRTTLFVCLFLMRVFRYDENLQCGFDTTRLNIAIHIRLGDRSSSPESRAQHLRLLEEFMVALTDVMAEVGMQPPLFHVFSETEQPCPSPETGVFDEFPTWPVEIDQVRNRTQHLHFCLERKGGDRRHFPWPSF